MPPGEWRSAAETPSRQLRSGERRQRHAADRRQQPRRQPATRLTARAHAERSAARRTSQRARLVPTQQYSPNSGPGESGLAAIATGTARRNAAPRRGRPAATSRRATMPPTGQRRRHRRQAPPTITPPRRSSRAGLRRPDVAAAGPAATGRFAAGAYVPARSSARIRPSATPRPTAIPRRSIPVTSPRGRHDDRPVDVRRGRQLRRRRWSARSCWTSRTSTGPACPPVGKTSATARRCAAPANGSASRPCPAPRSSATRSASRSPTCFGTAVSLGLSGYYYNRIYNEYTEQRLGGRVSLRLPIDARPLGQRRLSRRKINITNPIDPFLPDLAEVTGRNLALHGFQGR